MKTKEYMVDQNGNHIKLNRIQEQFIDFIQWCKDNNYQTSIYTLNFRGGKTYISKLFEKYLKEHENS